MAIVLSAMMIILALLCAGALGGMAYAHSYWKHYHEEKIEKERASWQYSLDLSIGYSARLLQNIAALEGRLQPFKRVRGEHGKFVGRA